MSKLTVTGTIVDYRVTLTDDRTTVKKACVVLDDAHTGTRVFGLKDQVGKVGDDVTLEVSIFAPDGGGAILMLAGATAANDWDAAVAGGQTESEVATRRKEWTDRQAAKAEVNV